LPSAAGELYLVGRVGVRSDKNPRDFFKEGAMLFVSEYRIAPENRNAAQQRFKKTGGPPLKG
jgi:hypothetical protein